jgi:hypothetical protein
MSRESHQPDLRRNLVVVRAGPRSLHPKWVSGGVPNFDLVAAAYDEAAPVAEGERRISIPGNKVAGFHRLFQENPHLLDYDRIALIDDDILADVQTINRCFDLGEEHDLQIWQPSLSPESYYTYAITLRKTGYLFRITDFVEMMCPFLTASALRKALPLLESGFETGIDVVWSRHPQFSSLPLAIVDAVSVTHTRPVGVLMADQGFKDDSYAPEIDQCLAQYGMKFSYPKVTAARLPDGRWLNDPMRINLSLSDVLIILGKSPHSVKYNLRAIYHKIKAIRGIQ